MLTTSREQINYRHLSSDNLKFFYVICLKHFINISFRTGQTSSDVPKVAAYTRSVTMMAMPGGYMVPVATIGIPKKSMSLAA